MAHLPYEEVLVCDNGRRKLHIRTYKDGWIWQHIDYSEGFHLVTDFSSTPVSKEKALEEARAQKKRFNFT